MTRTVYMSSNILMSINLVAGGLGYALLPMYAEAFLPKNVLTRPLVGNSPKVELLMVSPRDGAASSDAARSLMQLVRDLPPSVRHGA